MGETHRFRSMIEAARGGGAVAEVPIDVAQQIGGLKQLRIVGTVNGVAYRSSTMPYRGKFYMGVHKATREAAGVEIGDGVDIELTLDESPRVLELASELEAALAAEPELRARFDALSFSRRRELADPVSQAVRPETRMTRVEKALDKIRELG